MAIANQHLINFFETGRQKKHSAGELVLHGEDPSGVMLIKSGFVTVYSISDDGNKYVHIIYQPGEIFPLIWALKDIRRRIFYEAASEVVVWEVPKAEFLSYIQKDSKITYQVLNMLAEQFYIFADRLDNLQYKSAHERVAYRLLFLASRFGQHEEDTIIIKAPLTHELIGASINLARETVSREIEKLEKDNLIGRKNGYVVITDIDKLSEEFSEPITLNLWGLKPEEVHY